MIIESSGHTRLVLHTIFIETLSIQSVGTLIGLVTYHLTAEQGFVDAPNPSPCREIRERFCTKSTEDGLLLGSALTTVNCRRPAQSSTRETS